jgi:hypothetical protein
MANPVTSETHLFARCPACRRMVRVRRSGVLWLHYTSRAARYYCPGGRKPIYLARATAAHHVRPGVC